MRQAHWGLRYLQSDNYITDSSDIKEEDNLMRDKESYQDDDNEDGDNDKNNRKVNRLNNSGYSH